MSSPELLVEQLVDAAQQNPRIAFAVTAVVLVVVAAALSQVGRPGRDPQRMYSSEQRATCFTRAGHRCELSAFGIVRCQRPAAHADHHLPHSRGGATSMPNAVAACARHNTSKGATVPTFVQTALISLRRATYFPPGQSRKPGQWFSS